MRRWPFFTIAVLLLLAAFAPPVMAPSGAIAGEKLPPRAAQLAPDREIDRTGYIKGMYVSAAAMGNADFMNRVHDLLETTELNAVVLDYKSDRGYISFPTQVPLAQEIGADQDPQVKDPAGFMKWFKDHNVYTIARIPTFKDNLLTQAYPSLAIVDTATGGIWRDGEKMGWVDGNRTEAWEYNVELAKEAGSYGFDEVQFDYVRFPTDGNVSGAVYSKENTYDNRVAAISGFLAQASEALHAAGKKVSADIFGYTTWVADDLGIGQHIEVIAPYVDVLSPMVYPSTYSSGLPGEDAKYRNAVAYPYEIVNKSTERAVRRAKAVNPHIEIRPWLQDFQDYAFDYRTYTPGEIRRQMDGARDAGGRGWLLWDPAVRYTKEALVSTQPSFLPNAAGQIPVLGYSEVTPEVLLDDLEWLLAQGFYPTTVSDLATGKLSGVPAGKKPVVLTFDGSLPNHFKLLEGGRVDPASAAGVLLAFAAAHPADFPARATFYVNAGTDGATGTIFGSDELASFKLQTLVSWGFELGLVPLAAAGDATGYTAEQVDAAVAAARAKLAPLLPGYVPVSIALPRGLAAPGATTATTTAEAPARGYTSAVMPDGPLATSPFFPNVDLYHIPRLKAGEAGGSIWRDAIGASEIYISGGE